VPGTRADVWEIRVTTGINPVNGRRRQESFTHYGNEDSAACRRGELVRLYGVTPMVPLPQSAAMTVRRLLEAFLESPHRCR